MRRIAIVDPFSSGQFLAGECWSRNIEPIAVISGPDVPTAFSSSYFPDNFKQEVRIGDKPLTIIADLLRDMGCQYIVAGGCDSGVIPANLLAHRLGLPCNDPTKLHCLRDKFAMQDGLREAGLKYIQGVKVSSSVAGMEWAENQSGNTFIVKPVCSAATDSVVWCSDARDVQSAIDALLGTDNVFGEKNTEAVVQVYMEGTEYVVDTVSCNGETYVVAVLRYSKYVTAAGSVLYEEETFLNPDDSEVDNVTKYALRVIEALGVRFGAAHMEIMLHRDGPVLIEIGARLHGTLVPRHLQKICNVSQIDLLIDAATDPISFVERTRAPARLTKQSKTVWLRNTEIGVVRAIPGKQWAPTLSSFFSAIWTIEEGHAIRPTAGLLDSPGCIFLAHEDPRVLEVDTARIREREAGMALWQLQDREIGTNF